MYKDDLSKALVSPEANGVNSTAEDERLQFGTSMCQIFQM